MPRVVHFEIPCDDTDRAVRFYQDVFAWQINRWDGPQDYWLVTTGDNDQPGINGGLLRRAHPGQPVVNTINVPAVDECISRVVAHGGEVVMPKTPIPGIGWLAYFKDTEGNIFGVMQDDLAAG